MVDYQYLLFFYSRKSVTESGRLHELPSLENGSVRAQYPVLLLFSV